MNSLYGVTGWDRFRLYDKEGAAAVTATGREVIDFTEEAANELNYQVSYGDTDSVMLSLSNMSKEEAIETSFEIEDHINERYDDFARDELNADVHRFQIEFEKLYRRFFQAGKKKRYAGHIIWKEGKDVDDIDITGFEYKRSDIAQITKEVQQNVIETIVTGDDIDEDLEEIKSYLVDVIARVLGGDMDLDEIGIPGGSARSSTHTIPRPRRFAGRSTPTSCSGPTSGAGRSRSGCTSRRSTPTSGSGWKMRRASIPNAITYTESSNAIPT